MRTKAAMRLRLLPDAALNPYALPVSTDELDAIDECVRKGESVDDMLNKVHKLLQPTYHPSHTSRDKAQGGLQRQVSNSSSQLAPMSAMSGEHKRALADF
jgi:hypothetical protein